MSYEQVYSGEPGEPPYNQELNGAWPQAIYSQELDQAPMPGTAALTPVAHLPEPEGRAPEDYGKPIHVREGRLFRAMPFIALGSVVVLAAGAVVWGFLDQDSDDAKLAPVTLEHATQLPLEFASAPPLTLPKPVAQRYDSVVRVQDNGSNGSGVKAGPNLVWTSGNLVMPDGSGHPTPSLCDGGGTNIEDVKSSAFGYNDNVINWYGQYGGQSFLSHPDFALLKIEDEDASFTGLPTPPIASSTPTRGALAYFINYEATDNGTPRYPNSNQDQYLTGTTLSTAAEYAGVVLGYDNGMYMVATDLDSYGPSDDDQTHSNRAMTGGPVFSPTGALEGVSVNYRNTRASVEQIATDTGVQLTLPNQEVVDISFVQPLSRSLLASAKRQLGPKPNCDDY